MVQTDGMPHTLDDLIASFRDALIRTLRAAAPHFESWPTTPRGGLNLSGLSLDLFVQHGYVQISLRLREERELGGDIGSWANQGFLSSKDGPCDEELTAIVSSIEQFSGNAKGSPEDIRHLLFVAAAEALLAPEVANTLQTYGVNAPKFGASLGGYPFYFYVMDPDEALRVNYCDVIRANRATARVLGAQ